MHFVFSWSVIKTSLLRGKAGFADLIWSPKLVLKCLLHFSAGQVCKTSLNQLRPESCMIVLSLQKKKHLKPDVAAFLVLGGPPDCLLSNLGF